MGISDWFRKKPAFKVDPVESPSAAFPSCRSAILSLIGATSGEDVPNGWLSFESKQDGSVVCIQINGDHILLCDHPSDFSIVLSKFGLTDLSRRAVPVRGDQAYWYLEDANADEIASAVDAAFTHLCGKLYSVRGEFCEE